MNYSKNDEQKIIKYKYAVIAYTLGFLLIGSLLMQILSQIFIYGKFPDLTTSTYIEIQNNLIQYLDIGSTYYEVALASVKVSAITNFITYISLLGLVGLFLYKFIVEDFKEVVLDVNTKKFSGKKVLTFLGKVVIVFILYYIVSTLFGIVISKLIELLGITSDSSNNQEMIEAMLKYSPVFTILSTVLLGPIVEELIFRKSIFSLIKNKYTALHVSSLIFGSIHIISTIGSGASILEVLVLTLPYIFAGYIFGFIFIKNNKNFVFITFIHILSNLLSVIAVALS